MGENKVGGVVLQATTVPPNVRETAIPFQEVQVGSEVITSLDSQEAKRVIGKLIQETKTFHHPFRIVACSHQHHTTKIMAKMQRTIIADMDRVAGITRPIITDVSFEVVQPVVKCGSEYNSSAIAEDPIFDWLKVTKEGLALSKPSDTAKDPSSNDPTVPKGLPVRGPSWE